MRLLILLLLVCGAVWGGWASSQAADSSEPAWSTWVVYWDQEEGLRELASTSSLFQEVSFFAYHFDETGRLFPAAPSVLENRKRGIVPVGQPTPERWITVVNDVRSAQGRRRLKDAAVVHERIASEEAMQRHVEQLLEIAQVYDGLEVDYENLWARDKQRFSVFIRRLAEELHQRGQRLGVVVQAKTKEVQGDGPGAADWGALGESADIVKIMAYRSPGGRPGSLAPLGWVEDLCRFALTQIPEEKLAVVLALHGMDWSAEGPGRSLEYRQAMELAGKSRTTLLREAEGQTPHFFYQDPTGQRHEVWFEDARSVSAKMDRISQMGIRRLAFWRLGAGDRRLWERIKAGRLRGSLKPVSEQDTEGVAPIGGGS